MILIIDAHWLLNIFFFWGFHAVNSATDSNPDRWYFICQKSYGLTPYTVISILKYIDQIYSTLIGQCKTNHFQQLNEIDWTAKFSANPQEWENIWARILGLQ